MRKQRILWSLAAIAVVALLVLWRVRRANAPLEPSYRIQTIGDGQSVVFSSDSKLLMVGGRERVQFYHVASGRLAREWPSSSDPAWGAGRWWLSPGYKQVLEASENTQTRRTTYTLHEALTGRVLRQATVPGRLLQVSFESGLLICRERNQTVHLVDLNTGRARQTLRPSASAPRGWGSAHLLQRGTRLYLPAGWQGCPVAQLRGIRDGRRLLLLPPDVRRLTLSRDYKRFYCTEVGPNRSEKHLYIWDAASLHPTVIKTDLLHILHTFELENGTLLLEGGRLSPVGSGARAFEFVWQVRSPDGIRVLREFPAHGLVYSLGGRFFAVGPEGPGRAPNFIERCLGKRSVLDYDVFDAYTGNLMAHFGIEKQGDGSPADPDYLALLIFSPDNRHAALVGSNGLVRLYDLPELSS